MNIQVLRSFFEGEITAKELSNDLVGTTVEKSDGIFEHRMADLAGEYVVTTKHLILLCDAVLAGDLKPEQLAEIGFGMMASNHFHWDNDTPDGEQVAETVSNWSAPEVDYDLNVTTVVKFRHRLLTGEDTFTESDLGSRICRPIIMWKSNVTSNSRVPANKRINADFKGALSWCLGRTRKLPGFRLPPRGG